MRAMGFSAAAAIFCLLLVQDVAWSKTYHIYGRMIHGIVIRPGHPQIRGIIIVHPGGGPGPIGIPVQPAKPQ